ncbi:MAG TPA: diaminopimelate epimerase [Cyclobacteriaceae bacterium]|nr:diaminopimelate epimerase [Cyclobacteriaceae bacterium]
MEFEFYKYQGTGNDFVMLDDRAQRFDPTDLELIKRMCDRKFGIGADGLILIREKTGYDFEMIYFNADGSQSMCGNGARCAVAFSTFLGMFSGRCRFIAYDGPHEASYEDGRVVLGMAPVQEVTRAGEDYFVDTGSPHHVRFVEDVKSYPVVGTGARIRYNEDYQPKGTNVNFVSQISENEIYVRTYERGVEDETLSCGTGVTACALVVGHLKGLDRVKIQTPGGNLEVKFKINPGGGFEDIFLIGPAEQVFSGTIQVG